MSRSRNRGRNRNRGGNKGGQGQQQSQAGNRNKGRRRRRGGQRANKTAGFWGDVSALPQPTTGLRISEEPDAVVRSLGPPPLPGREQIAGHYFLAIYQRAVMTAGALAASGGLIDTEELEREFEDSDEA